MDFAIALLALVAWLGIMALVGDKLEGMRKYRYKDR